MHRESLLRLIEDYAVRHSDESAVVDHFLEFVAAHPDCFQRELLIGHITASTWIVDGTGKKVLLTHHAKLNRWLQPGGHADGEFDVLAVAEKEAREETGLEPLAAVSPAVFDLDIHPIPARGDLPQHDHFDVRFVFRHDGDGRFTVTHESHDLAWVPVEKLSDYTDEESIHRMARKWLARSSS